MAKASWFDICSVVLTTLFFVGTILVIIYIVHYISSRVAETKESLKNKGINISREGVSIKTDKRFDRTDYVDATQRGFVKALNAATCGPESNKQSFLPPSKNDREGLFGTAMRKLYSKEGEEKR